MKIIAGIIISALVIVACSARPYEEDLVPKVMERVVDAPISPVSEQLSYETICTQDGLQYRVWFGAASEIIGVTADVSSGDSNHIELC